MANTLMKAYDELANAESARNALLGSGFDSDHVQLTAREDEAGPAEGSFVLEYKDKTPAEGHDRSVFDAMFGGRDDPNEGRGHSPVAWRASYVLTVHAEDDAQLARASEIADRFGGIDVGEITSRHQGGH